MSKEAIELQKQINTLNAEFHEKAAELQAKHNAQMNVLFDARDADIPNDIWPTVVLSMLSESSLITADFDKELIEKYLDSLKIVLTATGHIILMKFKPNPYFEESELSATYSDTVDEEDHWEFSGITWKPNYRPKDDGTNQSFLEVFSQMPPHPEDDSDLESMESEEFEEAAHDWEEEMKERMTFFVSLRYAYTEVYNVVSSSTEESEPATKRPRTE